MTESCVCHLSAQEFVNGQKRLRAGDECDPGSVASCDLDRIEVVESIHSTRRKAHDQRLNTQNHRASISCYFETSDLLLASSIYILFQSRLPSGG